MYVCMHVGNFMYVPIHKPQSHTVFHESFEVILLFNQLPSLQVLPRGPLPGNGEFLSENCEGLGKWRGWTPPNAGYFCD